MTLYLSRLRLSQNPCINTLTSLLNPDEVGRRMDAHHRLLWSLFSADTNAKRDFLWRHDGGDSFLVLSHRRPGETPFFESVEVRDFAPKLRMGDRLAFALRANAARTRKSDRQTASGKPHKMHVDLVMDALHKTNERRSEVRLQLAQQVAVEWMQAQGQRYGFRIEEAIADGYSVYALPAYAGRRRGQPQFGVLEIKGLLTVANSDLFLRRLTLGFGRAKAFGCGLMLIRRV